MNHYFFSQKYGRLAIQYQIELRPIEIASYFLNNLNVLLPL